MVFGLRLGLPMDHVRQQLHKEREGIVVARVAGLMFLGVYLV